MKLVRTSLFTNFICLILILICTFIYSCDSDNIDRSQTQPISTISKLDSIQINYPEAESSRYSLRIKIDNRYDTLYEITSEYDAKIFHFIIDSYKELYKEYLHKAEINNGNLILKYQNNNHPMATVEIPLNIKSRYPLLIGDLNADGIKDYYIEVEHSFGTTTTHDIYFGIPNKNKIDIFSIGNDWKLMGHTECAFRANTIVNSQLLGKSYCDKFSNDYNNVAFEWHNDRLIKVKNNLK